jgi:hypothetical protein
MTARTVAWLTIATCLCAAAVETVLGCTSTGGLEPSDAILVLVLIGRYLLLAAFAWRHRDRRGVSWLLLLAAVGLSAWGVASSGWDSYLYHTHPTYRLTQRAGVFLVVLAQWGVVLLIGVALLALWLASRRGQAVNNRPT